MPKFSRGILVLSTTIVIVVFAVYVYSQKKKFQINETSKSQHQKKHALLYLLPMGNYSEKEARSLAVTLKQYYSHIEILTNVSLPANCMNDIKSRYRADKLLTFLNAYNRLSTFVIGLTHKDICIPKNGKDWGIFGLAYCPGNVCVVSDFRLTKDNKKEELKKVALHELGHSRGLPHCETEACWMQDAKGKNKLHSLHQFCFSCKQKMQQEGFTF